MKKYLLSMIMVAVVFSTGCDKTTDTPEVEEYNPTIKITSPNVGETGTVGQEMSIEANITQEDNKIIHNISVSIFELNGNIVETIIDDEHIHAVGLHHISEKFIPINQGEYILKISSRDHDDVSLKVETERSFTVIGSTYDVTVDIQSPVENSIIAVNDDLAINVLYTHDQGGTIHHVKIEIEDDAGNVVATLIDGHQHVEGTFTFENADAFTAITAGTFKIVARTMNMDMSIMQMAERTFTVQ